MKKTSILIFLSTMFVLTVVGQAIQIKGIVSDTTGTPLPGALVNLRSANHTLATSADANGNFTFPGIRDSIIHLSLRSVGYDSLSHTFSIDRELAVYDIGTIGLHEASNTLDEIVIQAISPVVLKEDTVEYDARAYQVREGEAVEEMVKKLPGIDVDSDGNITANGEPITSIRLDGKDYFGDDVAGAIQNLPADIVQNLQVIDDYGEQANVTGLKNGEPEKVLNINVKPDKKRGYFVKSGGGLGSEKRYRGRARANYLNGEQQLAADINANNTRNRSSGVSNRQSAKINYRDQWGEKLESYGSYRFNTSDDNSVQTTNRQSFFSDYTRFEDQESNSQSTDKQHRFSWNFEFRPDTNNYLKIEPDLRFGSNSGSRHGFTDTRLLTSSSRRANEETFSDRSSNLGLEVFYNHKFKKPRRNLSLDLEIGSSSTQAERDVHNDYTNIDSLGNTTTEQQYQTTLEDNQNQDMEIKGSYLEPLSPVSFLELAYRWKRTSNDILRKTNDIDPTDGTETINTNLSNDYDYHFTTNRFGLNYRLKNEKINSTFGLFAQPSVLSGMDFSRDIRTLQRHFNWVPSLRFAYQFSREKQLILNYNGRNNQPGFRQLQPVTDNSNLQNTITGNPDLKPEFTHQGRIEYRQTDVRSGASLYGRLRYNQTEDKIVTSKQIIADSVKQEITYLNTSGFYNASGDYSVSLPLHERMFVLSYYGGSTYSNNISLTNDERIVGKNLGIRQGLKFRVDVSDVMDTQINTSYSHSNATFSEGSIDDRSSSQLNVRLEGKNYFFNDLTLGYNFSKTFNRGYNAGIGDPTFLSLYLEHRFLRDNKGSIRLQGFDLFGQNTGIRRDIFDNEIVDQQSNRLSTYFLLSFNYRLEQFGT